jgi:hypothetical protein
MHAEKPDEQNINKEQCPGQEARPAEEQVNDLCRVSIRARMVEMNYSQT